MNEVLKTILQRRSIRHFLPQVPERDVLDAILQAACYAPSGSNHQSWRFTVLTHPEDLRALDALIREVFCELVIAPDDYPTKHTYQRRARENEAFSFTYHAPVLVIVSNERAYSNAMADSACAIQNMLLAAQSLGIGSCYINQLTWTTDEPRVRAQLDAYGIPQSHIVCGAVALGYPASGMNRPAAARKPGTVHFVSSGETATEQK